ncbi:MAG: TolC family protein [Elusimicrobia bacterium]|nr:TolC family protein [Elusimicrobiota bacterium]
MKSSLPARSPKAADMRTRILKTAIRLFAERGIDRVSIRELVAELGVSKPVLYYYFKDKEDLCREVFLRYAQEAGKVREEAGAMAAASFEDRLAAALEGHLRFFKARPLAVQFAMQTFTCPGSKGVRRIVDDFAARHRRGLRDLLRGWERKGDLRAGTSDDVLHLLDGVITHFAMSLYRGRAAGLDAGLPRRLARLICRGARAAGRLACIALALTATCVTAARAEGPRDITIEAAVELALQRNTSIVMAEKNKAVYDERVRQYYANALPDIRVGGQYSYNIEKPSMFIGGAKVPFGANNQYAASVEASQVLWSGGKVSLGVRMAKLFSQTGSEKVREARSGVKKAVRQLYYSILLASATVDIQRESLATAQSHLATIEAKFKQGIASDLAVLRQKVEVANTEPSLTKARNLYEKGTLQLNNLLGIDPEETLRAVGTLQCPSGGGSGPSADLAARYATALSNRPEVREARQQYDLAQEKVKLERSFHYPDLYGFWNRQFQGQDDRGWPDDSRRTWSMAAGVKLSIPVFSGLETVSKVKAAGLEAEQALEVLVETQRRVKIEVKGAWLDLQEASERVRSQAQAVGSAAKALAATEMRFKEGLAGQLELNDVTLALNTSRMIHAQAMHDACTAFAELQWAAGE